MVTAYYSQALDWLGVNGDQKQSQNADVLAQNFARLVDGFRPLSSSRIIGHEACARCAMNDEQTMGGKSIDLEKTPQDGNEAEKKYLVHPDAIDELKNILNDPVNIEQIYLSDSTNLRVRKVTDSNGKTTHIATLKGKKTINENTRKVVRSEVECAIPANVYEVFESFNLPKITKTRWRNKLLPGVMLDILKSAEGAILESEDVTGISQLRLHLIRIFQKVHVDTSKITQSTGDGVDNQNIAQGTLNDEAADYVDLDNIDIERVRNSDDLAAMVSRLAGMEI